MYKFALRPKWLLSHALMAVLIVLAVVLGFWQLDRLDGRRSTNREIAAGLAVAALPIDQIVGVSDGYDIGAEVRFRLAQARGTYVAEDEVLVLNRSLNGAPGYWVLTPLILDSGDALIVNRGWVPFSPGPGEPRPGTEAPTGEVRVEGMVRQTVVAQRLQRADPAEGVLAALARPDLARLAQQLTYDVLPVYLQLEAQDPPGLGLPRLLPRPELSEGPHLGYAVQWFIFAMIGLVGYPLVLRRIANTEGSDGRHSDIPVDYL